MAFEISEAGIAAARIGSHAELEFQAFKPGTLAVSPVKENVVDADEFVFAVRTLARMQAARKRKDAALILPDYATRIAVLDFDSFPSDPREQLSLIRFRLKRSVPFDVESAAVSYFAQPSANKKLDVVVVMAPLEIVSRYEAPFRAAGLYPGLVTTSSMAALELAPEAGLSVIAKLAGSVLTLAPEAGLSVIAKLAGSVLTVLVRDKGVLKLVRCLELPSPALDDVASVLLPTLVYIEDNLGGRAEKLFLCGFGDGSAAAEQRFAEELGLPVEPLRSPLGMPGPANAGLLGYLRSIAGNH